MLKNVAAQLRSRGGQPNSTRVSRQVEGLHKASGLDLNQPHGTRVEDHRVAWGKRYLTTWALNGATYHEITLDWNAWPSSRPILS